MLMMHESNEIACFSWITSLISKQTSTKTLPNTILTNQNLGERRGRTLREKLEREDVERERTSNLGFCASKHDVSHPSHVFI